MIGNFSGGIPGPSGVGITPQGVSTYILQRMNGYGQFGWRRDNWGQTDNYIRAWTDQNPNVVNGYRYDTAIMNRWMNNTITGEPQDQGSAGTFAALPGQMTPVQRYHATSVGNGNMNDLQSNITNPTTQANFRAASLAMGYQSFILTTGTMTTSPVSGGSINISLNWQNIGLAPPYRTWLVEYLLKNPLAGNWVSMRQVLLVEIYVLPYLGQLQLLMKTLLYRQ